MQAAGFPMGGEGLAVDLADTLVTVTEPVTDLLCDRAACQRFWTLHAEELPEGWAVPTLANTRRVRDTIRGLLDAAQKRVAFDRPALEAINEISDLARTSYRLTIANGRVERSDRWSAKRPANLALSAAARSAIAVVTTPALREQLRRCASPTCSMLFVKGDGRRRWCTPNICGNRDRVSRHYRRHRERDAESGA